MTDQLLGMVLGAVRMGLVVAALVVALVPIARSAITGFCPTGAEDGEAAADVVLASGLLATVVEPTATEPATPPPTDGATPPATDGAMPPATDGEVPAEADEPCGPGVERCLPPLVSGVLVFGEATCSQEAVTILRSRMLPAFGISTLLLAGAWVLRPRDGAPVISRR